MNNRLKIISVHGAPPMYEGIFAKKNFHGGTNFFGKKIYGKVVLDGRLVIRSCQRGSGVS